jgi:hypothetical protein
MRLPGMVAFVFATLSVGAPTSAPAHPGGLDANGCHTTRKTGDYHCHRGSGAQSTSTRSRALGALSPGRTYFRNCSEARAAGAAPIRAGQPGYSLKLDRDGDGIACE